MPRVSVLMRSNSEPPWSISNPSIMPTPAAPQAISRSFVYRRIGASRIIRNTARRNPSHPEREAVATSAGRPSTSAGAAR